MSEEFCEKVRISAMAILDGEKPTLPANEVDEHIRSCADCQRAVEQQGQTAGLLAGQSRRVFAEDVWPKVAVSIEASARPKHLREVFLFVLLGVFLLAYKVIEVLPGIATGVAIKLAPLVVVFVFFCLLRQNPFAINQNLRLEGDTQ
jgi:predicted anti-sigma-YlaC factor YlaD